MILSGKLVYEMLRSHWRMIGDHQRTDRELVNGTPVLELVLHRGCPQGTTFYAIIF